MISVIIPVYKVEKYISRCLDSVINQTYNNLEIILVDDGSPDDSSKICDEYLKKDSRVKVIHKENGGLSSARNAGLDICTGDYIFFIDSDDWLVDENVFSDFIAKAESEQSDFVYSFTNTANDENYKKIKMNYRFTEVDLFFLSNPYIFSAWNKLYAKELFQNIRFEYGRINEDVDIIPLIFLQAKNVTKLNRVTYNYYQNQDSITRRAFSEKRFDMFKSVKHVYENFNGSKKQCEVLNENLFGFQLFSVYTMILVSTKGKERLLLLNEYIDLLRKNNFNCFFRYSRKCFIHNESFAKGFKKLVALSYLHILYILRG